MSSQSEEIRLRYLYRDLVLKRNISLSLEGAMRLIGPDCVFHLYSITKITKKRKILLLRIKK